MCGCKWQLFIVWCCPFGLLSLHSTISNRKMMSWLFCTIRSVSYFLRVRRIMINVFCLLLFLYLSLSLSCTIYIQLTLPHMNISSHLAFTNTYWYLKHHASSIICFYWNLHCRLVLILNPLTFEKYKLDF